jgi:hypothetical protein
MKAAEHGGRRAVVGKASASDIAAGLALGRAVATIFVARAGTDGMRTAGGSPALWRRHWPMEPRRGEMPWKSMDVPARPNATGLRRRSPLDDDGR